MWTDSPGNPATLVLLPGLAGDPAMWHDQLMALADRHPIVTDVHMRHASIPEMAAALLARDPQPDEARIRAELSGNLCRCGTHVEIVRAVQLAASRLAGGTAAAATE